MKTLLFLTLLCAFFVNYSYGCTCLNLPLAQQVDQANNLILGVITDVNNTAQGMINQTITIVVEVTEVFKGSDFQQNHTYNLFTPSSLLMCGLFGMSMNETWVFQPYPIDSNTSTTWNVNFCGLNSLWSSLDFWTQYVISSGDVVSTNPCSNMTWCNDCVLVQVQCNTTVCPPIGVCLQNTTSNSTSSNSTSTPCSSFNLQDCYDHTECASIYANPCTGPVTSAWVGCQDSDILCAQHITCGVNQLDGKIYTFSDSCLPGDFTMFSPDEDGSCCGE